VNRIISEYSGTEGNAVDELVLPFALEKIFVGAQGSNTSAPIVKMNTSIACDTDVTWNRPLKIPKPDPIAWMYRALNDNAAA
jgi:hypothetical protein